MASGLHCIQPNGWLVDGWAMARSAAWEGQQPFGPGCHLQEARFVMDWPTQAAGSHGTHPARITLQHYTLGPASPNVLKCRRWASTAAISGVVTTAPSGSPLPMPLAKVTMSGTTPCRAQEVRRWRCLEQAVRRASLIPLASRP